MTTEVSRHLGSAHTLTAMIAAVSSGAVDALTHGPLSDEALAARLSWRREDASRLVEALAAYGIVSLHSQGAVLTELGHHLRADHPSRFRDALAVALRMHLPAMLSLSDGPPAKGAAECVYAPLAADPWLRDAFYSDLRRALPAIAEADLVDHALAAGEGTVVDVAGGDGTLVGLIARRFPERQFITFDEHWVVPDAACSNVRAESGDMFSGLPQGELYLLVRVLFNWRDDVAVRLLEAVAASATGKARRILVVEPARPPRGAFTGATPDLVALATGGRARTDAEMQQLAERAGLRVGRVGPAGPFVGWELVVG